VSRGEYVGVLLVDGKARLGRQILGEFLLPLNVQQPCVLAGQLQPLYELHVVSSVPLALLDDGESAQRLVNQEAVGIGDALPHEAGQALALHEEGKSIVVVLCAPNIFTLYLLESIDCVLFVWLRLLIRISHIFLVLSSFHLFLKLAFRRVNRVRWLGLATIKRVTKLKRQGKVEKEKPRVSLYFTEFPSFLQNKPEHGRSGSGSTRTQGS
jgi:hypothetical protein